MPDVRSSPLPADGGRQTTSTSRPRIVWAEDHVHTRDFVAELLGASCDVEAVGDGREALAAIRRAPPDLVIADVTMPGLDGLELLQEIRADAATAAIPVMLISGRASQDSRVEGMQAGADDYVTKPFSPRELVARVDAHVKLGQLRRELVAAREETAARQAYLLRLTDALRPLSDAIAIEHEASRILRDELGATRVNYCELSEDGGGVWTTTDVRLDSLPPLLGQQVRFADFDPETAAMLSLGGPVHRADVLAVDTLTAEQRAAFAAIGTRAYLAIPLVKAGRLVAALALHHGGPHEWTATEIRIAQETADRTWASVERARAEKALRQSEERLLRLNEHLEERVRERTAQIDALFRRLVSVQEEERRRISRDIHDQLGQQMTALRVTLDALQAQSDGNAALAGRIGRAQRLAEELDDSIDFLTWQLRPATLDHLGLPEALRHLLTGWSERFGVTADFDVQGEHNPRLPRDVKANVYRIVQEALHNVARHAGATHVNVFIDYRGDETVVVIEDDGRGFDAPAATDGHGHRLGLVSMRERASLAGGRLTIESAPGSGTAIFVWIPTVPQPRTS